MRGFMITSGINLVHKAANYVCVKDDSNLIIRTISRVALVALSMVALALECLDYFISNRNITLCKNLFLPAFFESFTQIRFRLFLGQKQSSSFSLNESEYRRIWKKLIKDESDIPYPLEKTIPFLTRLEAISLNDYSKIDLKRIPIKVFKSDRTVLEKIGSHSDLSNEAMTDRFSHLMESEMKLDVSNPKIWTLTQLTLNTVHQTHANLFGWGLQVYANFPYLKNTEFKYEFTLLADQSIDIKIFSSFVPFNLKRDSRGFNEPEYLDMKYEQTLSMKVSCYDKECLLSDVGIDFRKYPFVYSAVK